jgi:hypothetical protein
LTRLHIVGCPRSGTSLLLELLATCFENDGHCAHELSLFDPAPIRGGLYISKQPTDIRRLRYIFPRDHGLHILYIFRDPRAVVTSMHAEHPGMYFCNYRIWNQCHLAAGHYLDHPRFHSLRYEDLVAQPDAAQEEIANQFSFLRQRHRFRDFHEHAVTNEAALRAMNGLRPISTEDVQVWRRHLPRLAQQLQRWPGMARELVALGYEADDGWQSVLDGVEARNFPCRYPESRPLLREWETALRTWWRSRRYLQHIDS